MTESLQLHFLRILHCATLTNFSRSNLGLSALKYRISFSVRLSNGSWQSGLNVISV